MLETFTNQDITSLLKDGEKVFFEAKNYPSRGQTATQELYQTKEGKLFLKRVSQRNHEECRINTQSGTLAEREFWAFCLARAIGLFVPAVWLIDELTTVQIWLDYPDGRTFKKSTGGMKFQTENIFNCAIFDWLTGQIDRHDANYLYNYKDELVIPVDSAHGFLKYDGSLPDYLHIFEIGAPSQLNKKIRSDVKAKLDALLDIEIENLVPLRDPIEAETLSDRKERLGNARCIMDILNLFRSKR